MSTLVVDDDPAIRERLSKILTGAVKVASDIEEGLEIARAWQPAVVMLDVIFRKSLRNGIEEIPGFKLAAPRCQIIVMTAAYHQGDADLACHLGALYYAAKDSEKVLVACVEGAREMVGSIFVRPAVASVH
jgi:DNA-binding NtrC family response regulator